MFKKYLPGFDHHNGGYEGMKRLLDDAIDKLRKDVEVASSAVAK